MRKTTVRRGIRCITFAIFCVLAVTFFPGRLSELFLLGWGGETRVTVLGFFLGGVFGGFGVLTAAAGLVLDGGPKESQLRLTPAVLLLLAVIGAFLFLFYHSFSAPPAPRLQPGQSITI